MHEQAMTSFKRMMLRRWKIAKLNVQYEKEQLVRADVHYIKRKQQETISSWGTFMREQRILIEKKKAANSFYELSVQQHSFTALFRAKELRIAKEQKDAVALLFHGRSLRRRTFDTYVK